MGMVVVALVDGDVVAVVWTLHVLSFERSAHRAGSCFIYSFAPCTKKKTRKILHVTYITISHPCVVVIPLAMKKQQQQLARPPETTLPAQQQQQQQQHSRRARNKVARSTRPSVQTSEDDGEDDDQPQHQQPQQKKKLCEEPIPAPAMAHDAGQKKADPVVVADASLSEESNDALYKAIMNYKRMEQQRARSLISDTKTITEAILRKQAEARNARNVITACTSYATNAKYMQVNGGQHPRIRVFPGMHALSPDEVDVYTSLVEPCASAIITVMHNHCMSEQVNLSVYMQTRLCKKEHSKWSYQSPRCTKKHFWASIRLDMHFAAFSFSGPPQPRPQGTPPSLALYSIFFKKKYFFSAKNWHSL
jgi:hypothetical protein